MVSITISQLKLFHKLQLPFEIGTVVIIVLWIRRGDLVSLNKQMANSISEQRQFDSWVQYFNYINILQRYYQFSYTSIDHSVIYMWGITRLLMIS